LQGWSRARLDLAGGTEPRLPAGEDRPREGAAGDPDLVVGVAVPRRWSFPCSHATSTAADAIKFFWASRRIASDLPAKLGMIATRRPLAASRWLALILTEVPAQWSGSVEPKETRPPQTPDALRQIQPCRGSPKGCRNRVQVLLDSGAGGYPVDDADVQRLSPLVHDHINLLDRCHFTNPDNPADELRPLRDPRTADD